MLPIMLVAQGKRAFDRRYLFFYLMAGGWLLGTLLADAYNDIGLFNRAKGTARVIFFILDFMALSILINYKTRRIIVFALSIGFVLFVGSWEFSRDFLLQWKFGMSHTVTLVALLISVYFYRRRRYGIYLAISLTVAAINFRYGFRSQLVIDFIATVLILPSFRGRVQAPSSRSYSDFVRIVVLLVVAGGAAYGANLVLKYAAEKGIFDESTNEKFVAQAGGDYGVLVGGRPETIVAIQAIIDMPITGHGSFPYGLKYLQMKQDIQYEHGYSDSDEADEADYPVIPTHSHLTLAWVEDGILGGICWIYFLILVVRALIRLSQVRPDFAPVYSYLLVNFLWDILYSPFGSVNRIHAAFYILIAYFILKTPAPGTVKRSPVKKVVYRKRTLVQLGQLPAPSGGSLAGG
jgi:hypothetical protein